MTKNVHNKQNIILPKLKKPDFSDFPNKQRLLINTAWSLFNTYGYRRTTVTDICKTAGTSKVTFYKYFGSKLGVTKSIIERIIDVSQEYFNSVMDLKLNTTEKFKLIVSMKENMAHWLSHVFYMDLIDSEDEVGSYFMDLQKSRLGLMREFFSSEQKQGSLDRTMNVDFMVHIIQKISESINDEKIKDIYKDDLPKLSKDVTNFIFFGITRNE